MGVEDQDDEATKAGDQYARSDKELHEYFTSSLGVKAQAYEPSGGGGAGTSDFLPSAIMASGHVAMEARRSSAVSAAIHAMTSAHARVLDLVYYPRRLPEGPDGSRPHAASVLRPSMGHGTYLFLAATTIAALAAFDHAHGLDVHVELPPEPVQRDIKPAKWAFHEPRPAHNRFRDQVAAEDARMLNAPIRVYRWLVCLSEPAKDVEKRTQRAMLEGILSECDGRRQEALAAYAAIRQVHIGQSLAEKAARSAEQKREASKHVDESIKALLERDRARAEARHQRRLNRDAS